MKKLLFICFCIVIVSCKNSKEQKLQVVSDLSQTDIRNQNHPGKKLLETNCYSCHNPKAAQSAMLAPPMIAVKRHYVKVATTKKEFTEALQTWMNDPEAPSKMPGAVKKFGRMPYLPFPKETVTQIADYIYENEIEKPKWFDVHFQEEHGKGMGHGKGKNGNKMKQVSNESSLSDIGMELALSTKAVLGKNLMGALNKKGTIGALEFCNTKAITLTDSMSVVKNAKIKRVSDKPRNQNNLANDIELDYIESFKKAIKNGEEIKPVVVENNEKVQFYAPITTNAMCIQCHGKPNENIKPETLATLKSLYPKDKAVGYDVNQVRGIWVVNFKKNNLN